MNSKLYVLVCFVLQITFEACSEKVLKVTETEKKSITTILLKPVEEPPKILTLKNAEEIVNIPKGIDSNLVVSMSRSPCFGKCQAYNFSVSSDGTAVYEGIAFVSKLGKHTAQVSKSEMNKFLSTFQLSSLQALSENYPTKGITVSDLPTTKTYIRLGKIGKLITDNYDAPVVVLDLETRVQTFAESLNWKKTEN